MAVKKGQAEVLNNNVLVLDPHQLNASPPLLLIFLMHWNMAGNLAWPFFQQEFRLQGPPVLSLIVTSLQDRQGGTASPY